MRCGRPRLRSVLLRRRLQGLANRSGQLRHLRARMRSWGDVLRRGLCPRHHAVPTAGRSTEGLVSGRKRAQQQVLPGQPAESVRADFERRGLLRRQDNGRLPNRLMGPICIAGE